MSVQRSKFATADEIYLLSHSVGLAPRTLRQYVADHYFNAWETAPENVWPEWLAAIDEFRDALGNLFNATAGNFCPQSNVSSATTKILYSLPELRKRQTILLNEGAFPSLGYVFQMGNELGFNVKYVENSEDAQDADVWKEQMSADVGLALITHVHSNNGLRIPVSDIVRLARERSVISIVDTAQSNGVLPIDLKRWNADFVVGSCVKWLCGGPGAGFLWANPSILDRTAPIDVGWFSHADPFEFDIHRFRYAKDALRFWGGTPSILPYVAATHSMNTLAEIGYDTIHEHNATLSQRLIDAIDDSMLVSPRDAARRGATVVIRLGKETEQIKARLSGARIRYDERTEGIRLSPHIYNSTDDVSAVIDCLR